MTRNQRLALWIAVPAAGVIWTALRARGSWWYLDEWDMIERTHRWGALWEGHQGHLEIQNYLTYRFQRSVFGLETRVLVYTSFAASVAALQVSVALVLRRLGVHDLLALLAGGMIVYFGPGAQNAVFQFQQGINFAYALCFLAAWVALRDDRTREGALTIAGLLLLAVGADSGLAPVGAVYVGILVVILWPWRLALWALVIPAVANVAWFTIGEPARHIDPTGERFWDFVENLLAVATAGLVGGGERYLPGAPDRPPAYPLSTTETALLIGVLVISCAVLCRRLLTRQIVASLVAGVVAATVTAVAIAYDRAWLIDPLRLPGSRYVQWTAVFLLVAFLPVLVAALTPASERARRLALAGASVIVILVFVVNLTSFDEVQRVNDEVGEGDRTTVAQVIDLLENGCDPGQHLDPEAVVVTDVTVGDIEDFVASGALSPSFAIPATEGTKFLFCADDGP